MIKFTMPTLCLLLMALAAIASADEKPALFNMDPKSNQTTGITTDHKQQTSQQSGKEFHPKNDKEVEENNPQNGMGQDQQNNLQNVQQYGQHGEQNSQEFNTDDQEACFEQDLDQSFWTKVTCFDKSMGCIVATKCPVSNGMIVSKEMHYGANRRDYRDFRGCVSNWKTKLMGLKTAEDWCKTEAYSPCEKCRVCHPKNGKNNFCNGDGLHRIYRGLNVGLVFASLGAVLAAVWAHAINGIVGI